MWNESLLSQVLNTAAYALYYYFKQEEASDQTKFFMYMLKEDTLERVLQLPQTRFVKWSVQRTLPLIGVDKQIDIPISQVDELTLENIDDVNIPKMIMQDLNLDFIYEQEEYDKNEYIRFQIISDKDWGTMDWITGAPIDVRSDPAIVDTVILYVHGGGFICGSAASTKPFTYHITQKTGYPVFSVDYRLSPD
jgi:hypothetical protein